MMGSSSKLEEGDSYPFKLPTEPRIEFVNETGLKKKACLALYPPPLVETGAFEYLTLMAMEEKAARRKSGPHVLGDPQRLLTLGHLLSLVRWVIIAGCIAFVATGWYQSGGLELHVK